MKGSINRKGISEQVADTIKKMIHEGKYKVGDKIPGEREFAAELEVSRNTVREAYKILEAYGYITAKHGTGVFVASPEQQILKMTESFFISTDQIKDFFSVRKILEENTVQWAIENSTTEQIHELDEIIKQAESVINKEVDYKRLSELDHKFHLALANSSQNVVLIRIMHNLIDLLSESRMHSIQIPGRAIKSVEEHSNILNAIKIKDIALAKKCMSEHLDSVQRSMTNKMADEYEKA
ncbi:FadR/GntR family transcriptional regulator [Bacillus sp. OK048]|uniref:FadR/GntR family transcriptional regulator n=1 Tax=Bacillus sp. OK048 TaxID=1882761 RepID=UPI00088CDFC7|nr:FadR/GntR family transcriptional regulator [Bacillus sp. OK048]SDN39833.1 transcriptional regulator, GntR family [Bacillus sp. OK048]